MTLFFAYKYPGQIQVKISSDSVQYLYKSRKEKNQAKNMICKVLLVACLAIATVQGRMIQLKNNGGSLLTVSMSGASDVQLMAGQMMPVNVADNWSGTISACNGVCDGPRTEVKMSLGATDSYAVSLKNGFNLGAKVIPVGGANCDSAVCAARITNACPIADQVRDSLGQVVACRNSPLVMHRMCPHAIVSDADVALNTRTCTGAMSYMVMLG